MDFKTIERKKTIAAMIVVCEWLKIRKSKDLKPWDCVYSALEVSFWLMEISKLCQMEASLKLNKFDKGAICGDKQAEVIVDKNGKIIEL